MVWGGGGREENQCRRSACKKADKPSMLIIILKVMTAHAPKANNGARGVTLLYLNPGIIILSQKTYCGDVGRGGGGDD